MEPESSRKKLIEEFSNFTLDTNITLSGILGELEENGHLSQGQIMLTCPFDSNHRIPENSLEQHLELCQWRAEGYDEQDLALSISSLPPDNPHCIKFDEEQLENVLKVAKQENPSMNIGVSQRLIPRTSDRLVADFTTDERKILYEYVIANTVQVDIGEDIADLNKPRNGKDQDKRISYLEMVAQERNLKRRRAKHRGVHTNKKSDIEIMREVINQQMEMLAEYIAEKEPVKVEKSFAYHAPERESGKIGDDRNYRRNHSLNSPRVSSRDRYRHQSERKVDERRDKGRIDGSKYSRISSRDSSEENLIKYKSKRENNRYRDDERRDKSNHSNKSSRDRDRPESRHRKNSEERKHHRSRERRESNDRNYTKYRSHKSKEYDRRKSSRSSRHDDNYERSRKGRE